MLPDRLSQLLTAYIDGELSARQRKAVARLLHRSEEARTLLQKLQEDASVLRNLPRVRLDHDISHRVLASIADRRLQVSRRARLAQCSVYPAWASLASAAAVLFVVGVGSYLYFVTATHVPQLAKRGADSNTEPEIKPEPEKQPIAKTLVEEPLPEAPENVPPSRVAMKEKSNASQDTEPVATAPEKEPDQAVDAIPTPQMEVFKKLDDIKLALRLNLRELDQERQQQRLREKLQEDKAFHLDLVCPDTAKGIDRLEAAFKAQGIRFLVDQTAQARLKKGLKTNYAFYSEDLTPEELTRLMQQLGSDDKKVDARRRFDRVVINHLTPANTKELSSLLGVDPKMLPTRSGTPFGVDIRKPLAQNTADQLAQALAGQGTPRPEPGKPVPAVKLPERLALVLAYNPVRTKPSTSREVKQFLDTRKERRPGSIQILLVLRSGNG